jgi:hypothetical protein
VTVQVLTDVAAMEAVVHYTDLIDAVGGDPMGRDLAEPACDLLCRVAGAIELIEARAGRRPDVRPAIR